VNSLSRPGVDSTHAAQTALRDPVRSHDRDAPPTAGWFPSVLAGASRGSVILSGHTYHDESAIFKTSFNQTARVGMTVQLSCAGGGFFSYRVTEANLNLRVEDYSAFIDSRGLYAKDGPARVVIITCTNWNPVRRDYDQRGVLIATPL